MLRSDLVESTAVAAAGGDEAVLDACDIVEAAGNHPNVVDHNVVAGVAGVGEADLDDDSVAQEEPMNETCRDVNVRAGDIAARVRSAEARRAIEHVQSREAAVSKPQHPMKEKLPPDALTSQKLPVAIAAPLPPILPPHHLFPTRPP